MARQQRLRHKSYKEVTDEDKTTRDSKVLTRLFGIRDTSEGEIVDNKTVEKEIVESEILDGEKQSVRHYLKANIAGRGYLARMGDYTLLVTVTKAKLAFSCLLVRERELNPTDSNQ